MAPYNSHKPILEFMLQHIDPNGLILECGGGAYSTPLICNHTGPTITLETDPQWYQKISNYHQGIHTVKLITDWQEEFDKIDYIEMAFVDQHPWQSRCQTLRLLKNKAKYIVLHDAMDEHIDLCDWFDFKYHTIYCVGQPGANNPSTMVASNMVEIDFDIPECNTHHYKRDR